MAVYKIDRDELNKCFLSRDYGGGEIRTQKGFDYLAEKKLENHVQIFNAFRYIVEANHDFNHDESEVCWGCMQDRDFILYAKQIECRGNKMKNGS